MKVVIQGDVAVLTRKRLAYGNKNKTRSGNEDLRQGKELEMKKVVSVMMAVILTAALFAGCGKEDENTPASSSSADSSFLSAEESQQEADGSKNQGVVDPIDMDDEHDSSGSGSGEKSGIVTEQSDYGYSIVYDASKYEYKRVEGCDDYALKKYEADRPTVYVSISLVEKEYIGQAEASLFGEGSSDSTIGREKAAAKYSGTEDTWDEGKILCGVYLCTLPDGNALLIETQSYTVGENDSYSQDIRDMLDSIVLK